jgi:hypothetical protein
MTIKKSALVLEVMISAKFSVLISLSFWPPPPPIINEPPDVPEPDPTFPPIDEPPEADPPPEPPEIDALSRSICR